MSDGKTHRQLSTAFENHNQNGEKITDKIKRMVDMINHSLDHTSDLFFICVYYCTLKSFRLEALLFLMFVEICTDNA